MHGVRQQAAGAVHLAEEEIHGVDTMRADVVERAAAGHGGIHQPIAPFQDFGPSVAVGLGQQRPADGALGDELLRADELRIEPAVIRDAKKTPGSARCGHHPLRLREVDSHGLFAEHVFPSAQSRDGGVRVQRHGQRDVDGVHRRIGDRFFHRGPRLCAGKFKRLGGVASDKSVHCAARLSLNGGDDPLARNVANAGEDPMQFVAHEIRITFQRRKR